MGSGEKSLPPTITRNYIYIHTITNILIIFEGCTDRINSFDCQSIPSNVPSCDFCPIINKKGVKGYYSLKNNNKKEENKNKSNSLLRI